MNILHQYWLRRKYWWPNGYRLKLFLSFLGVMILCGTGLIVLFGQIQRQTLLEETHSQGRYISSILARNLETPLFFMNRMQINANVEAILEATDLVAVFIYDKDGQRIFSHVSPQAGASAFGPDELAHYSKIMTESFPLGEEEVSIHGHQGKFLTFGKRIISAEPSSDQAAMFFDTGEPQESAATDLGSVQLVFSLAKYQRGTEQIIRHAALIFLTFLPISLFIAFLLARDVVKPLRVLVESMRIRLGKREEDEKEEEEEETTDELGQLDTSLKQLVGRLDQSFATIAQMNEGLEKEVAARTAELTRAMQELKETQAQITQTEKMAAVGQLVAGVAHEVNNTTNFVTGALPPLGKRLEELRKLLADQGKQPPDPERPERIDELMRSIDLLLGNIREGARRTSKIVSDLKNFSRPDNDLIHQIDINHCLESTLALTMPEYRSRIELVKELSPDLPMVPGSQGQLCQVFMNMIINAVHAQPDHGFLLIRTFRAEDGVHVVFADKGPGIPKNIQARIFEPFFTTKKIGTGLGLSVSFGIINKHRGTILVHSEPGQGAEFEIILPERPEPVIIEEEK
ncbi:MAG: ATP-binding protein [Desulfurivibrionaceae bacterium]